MKHLGLSGGGTKITGLLGAVEVMMTEKGYTPDVISGISAGSVLALPLALGKFDEVREIVLNMDLSTFFNVVPVKKNGKLKMVSALSKLIRGNHYLGEQYNLEKELRKMVSRSEFDAYKSDPNSPDCVVGAVDFYTGRRFYANLKKVSYEQFPPLVNASSSIPIFTPGVLLNGPVVDFEGENIEEDMFLFDGGVRDHNPTYRILSSSSYNFSQSASVYSRPKDYKILNNDCEPKNLLKVLGRYTDISSIEVSKNDQYQEEQYFKDHPETFNHGTFFLPSIMKDVYDVDKTRLKELYDAGKKEVREKWKEAVIA